MITDNVKVVAHGNEPSGNYHPNPQFPLSLRSCCVSAHWLVWSITFLFWFTLTALTTLIPKTLGHC